MKNLHLSLGSAALLFGACAEGPKNPTDDFGYDGTGIAFQVSPLTLGALDDSCYSFAVVSQLNQLVVGRGPSVTAANLTGVTGVPATVTAAVCASQFGNSDGGDISYIAPCHASENAKNHTVRLWVNALCEDGGVTPNTGGACTEIQSYVNPCPAAGGCSLAVTCVENADTPVTFNLTIMGQADQGFFDVAVNFDDVFCSAKLDDCNTLGQPIRLMFDTVETVLAPGGCPWGTGRPYGALTAEQNTIDYSADTNPDGCASNGFPHFMQLPGDLPSAPPGPFVANPNLGQRIDTIVAAIACTAGPGNDVTTHLTFTSLSVGCSAPVFQQGQLTFTSVMQEGNRMIGPFPSAVYFGTESLPGVNTVFTTVAIGIGDQTDCSLQWQVIPSDGAQDFGQPGEYNSFGFVNFEGNGLGSGCNQFGLNEGSPDAVTTMYFPNAPVQPTAFNSQLPEGSETFQPWQYICYNSAQEVAALKAEVDDMLFGAQTLHREVMGATFPDPAQEELVAELATLMGRYLGASARFTALANCTGFVIELEAIRLTLEAAWVLIDEMWTKAALTR